MTFLVSSDSPLMGIIKSSLCDVCLDSGLTITSSKPRRCPLCFHEDKRFSAPAVRLALCIWEREDKQQSIDELLFATARFLTRATSEYPITLVTLAEYFRCSERKVKDMIRTLRREWLLPIGSSRQPPYGYFWIQSAADFLSWSRPYRSQAIDELVTLWHLEKRNFPELAGQTSLDFQQTINSELEEAIK